MTLFPRPVLVVTTPRIATDVWPAELAKWSAPGAPPLYAKQRECCAKVWKAWTKGSVGRLENVDVGVGKTRIGIELIRAGRGLKAGQEAKLQVLWHKSKAKRTLRADPGADVCVTTFDSFRIMDRAGAIAPEQFSAVFVDESAKAKNPEAKVTEVLRRWARGRLRTLELTGNACPGGNAVDWWSQLDIAQPSQWGTLKSFCGKHLRAGQLVWYDANASRKWGKHPNMKQRVSLWHPKDPVAFAKMLAETCVDTVTLAEVLELPPLMIEEVPVRLSPGEQRVYDRIRDEAILETGTEELRLENDMALRMKLRQASGGMVLTPGGDVVHATGKSSKVATAVDIATTELEGKPFLAFYQFVAEARALLKELERAGVEALLCEGQRQIDAWREGAAQALVLHPQSAGHGLTLTRAAHEIWLGPPVDPDHWKQGVGRIKRGSQVSRMVVFMLLAEGTMDGRIFKNALAGCERSAGMMKLMAAASAA